MRGRRYIGDSRLSSPPFSGKKNRSRNGSQPRLRDALNP